MKYNKEELMLLSEKLNGDKLTKEEKIALNKILSDYNKVFYTAVKQQKFIKRKEKEYASEMDQNFKFIERNNFLESEYKKYKVLYKEQNVYIKTLEKQLAELKKALINKNSLKGENK